MIYTSNMTRKEHKVLGYIKKWKKLLKLDDWDIELRIVNRDELLVQLRIDEPDTPELVADQVLALTDVYSVYDLQCVPYIQERASRVFIKDTYFKDSSEEELESTVLHELLHIFLALTVPKCENLAQEVQLERVIMVLEKLLMNKEK